MGQSTLGSFGSNLEAAYNLSPNSTEIHTAGDSVKDANLTQWVQEEIG